MARKKTPQTREIESLLRERFPDHSPEYPPKAYRYNSASIRVRLVSDRFEEMNRSERERMVMPIIRDLDEETRADITVLLLLTPEEMTQSLMNLEFEHPTPSRL